MAKLITEVFIKGDGGTGTTVTGESKERIEEELRKRNKGLKNKSEKQKIRQGEKPKSKEKSSQRMGRTSSNTIHPYGE